MRAPLMSRSPCLLTIALCVSSLSGCFLFDRANPRLTAVTRTRGDVIEKTTIGYDDDGFPSRVVMERPLATQTLDFAWTDGVLDSARVKNTPTNDAFAPVESTVRLTWDADARRVASTEEITKDRDPDDDIDPPVTTGTLDYEDSGRITALGFTTSAGNAEVRDNTAFSYDDAALAALTATSKVVVNGETTASDETIYRIEAEDGRPGALTVEADVATLVLAVEVDDEGRIGAFEGARTYKGSDREDNVVVGFSYDDEGRLVSVTASDDDGLSDDPITELTYEDGEAQGLDVTPYSIFFFGLWDLEGKGRLSLEPERQSARFVLPTW